MLDRIRRPGNRTSVAIEQLAVMHQIGISNKTLNNKGNHMSSTLNQHRSRFGFHPCDYALFCKLKYLHKHYWIALRQFHTWHRWFRKQPQNRDGTEPKYCQPFVKNQPWAKPIKAGFKLYPRTVLDHEVIEIYQSARTPSAEPVEALSLETVKAIEALFAKVQLSMEANK